MERVSSQSGAKNKMDKTGGDLEGRTPHPAAAETSMKTLKGWAPSPGLGAAALEHRKPSLPLPSPTSLQRFKGRCKSDSRGQSAERQESPPPP